MGNKSVTLEWLEQFYQGEVNDNHQCAVWTMNGKKHYWCTSIDQAAEQAALQKGDTYFSMGLFPRETKRRKQENVECIFGVWLDIDVGNKGKGAKYFPDMEAAITWVYDTLSGMWTHIVHSGGGLHIYLMFDEPFWIKTDADREIAQKLVRAYWSWANDNCDYTIDALTDLSRIMRLPGTMHTGKGELCALVESSTTVAAPLELLDKLPSVKLPDESGQVAGLDGDCNMEQVKRKLALIQETDLTFSQTWRRMRRFKDSTPSGYCLSLANQLCVAGFNDSEIQAALEMWRSAQLDANPKPPEWYHGTIKKARAAHQRDDEEVKFDNQLTLSVLETDEKQQQETTEIVFGAPVESFVKHITPHHKGRKERVSYTMNFQNGASITIPSSSTLLNQGAMKELLLEELSLVMKRLKTPQYDKVIQLLLGMRTEDMGEIEGNLAFSVEQELRTFIGTKVENCETTKVLNEYQRNMLFEEDDGQLYFSWQAFKIRLSNSDVRMPNKELADMLMNIGCAPKQFNDKKRTRLWSAPDEN